MKARVEVMQAVSELTEELSFGILDKALLARKTANLVAALEVFTDLNFTEAEQSELFNLSAQRLKEIQERVK
jgi:hypothetical protein